MVENVLNWPQNDSRQSNIVNDDQRMVVMPQMAPNWLAGFGKITYFPPCIFRLFSRWFCAYFHLFSAYFGGHFSAYFPLCHFWWKSFWLVKFGVFWGGVCDFINKPSVYQTSRWCVLIFGFYKPRSPAAKGGSLPLKFYFAFPCRPDRQRTKTGCQVEQYFPVKWIIFNDLKWSLWKALDIALFSFNSILNGWWIPPFWGGYDP